MYVPHCSLECKPLTWRIVEFDPDCEAMILTTDGTPLQGITGGHGGDRRVEYIIPRSAVKAGKHEFVIESSCNGMFGVPWNGDTIAPPDVSLLDPSVSGVLVAFLPLVRESVDTELCIGSGFCLGTSQSKLSYGALSFVQNILLILS